MATGKHAWFICDNCGFRYKYMDRRKTSYGTIVCRDCHDGAYDLHNHPQNFPSSDVLDDESLEEARPETKVFTSAGS